MAINKVTFGDEVLIDLTLDTVDDTTVVKGKLYHKPNGEVSEGTNTNNADTSADTVTEDKVKKGITFHKADGSSAVGTNRDVDVSDTTANMGDVLKGKNFYDKDGYLTEGLIETKDVPYWNTISDKMGNVTFGAGYYPNGATVALDPISTMYLMPQNIKKDIEILGVTGTLEGDKKVVEGIITTTTSARKVTLGFKPSVVYVLNNVGKNTYFGMGIFYADGTSIGSRMGASGGAVASPPVNVSILNDGFNIQSVTSNFNRETYYVAIE